MALPPHFLPKRFIYGNTVIDDDGRMSDIKHIRDRVTAIIPNARVKMDFKDYFTVVFRNTEATSLAKLLKEFQLNPFEKTTTHIFSVEATRGGYVRLIGECRG